MGLTQKARRRWWWLRDVKVVDCPCVSHVLSWLTGMRAHGRICGVKQQNARRHTSLLHL